MRCITWLSPAVVAETVIVGVLPEALTNVIGSPSELAGIINDYGAAFAFVYSLPKNVPIGIDMLNVSFSAAISDTAREILL